MKFFSATAEEQTNPKRTLTEERGKKAKQKIMRERGKCVRKGSGKEKEKNGKENLKCFCLSQVLESSCLDLSHAQRGVFHSQVGVSGPFPRWHVWSYPARSQTALQSPEMHPLRVGSAHNWAWLFPHWCPCVAGEYVTLLGWRECLIISHWEGPGDPVVRTRRFHRCHPSSIPGLGTEFKISKN